MTTNFDSLSTAQLIRIKEALLRYADEIDKIINQRQEDRSSSTTPSDILSSIFSSKTDKSNEKKETVKSSEKSKKSPEKSKKSKKSIKIVKSATLSDTRKIKATIADMKLSLTKNSISFKSTVNRDELEEMIRKNNLVRYAEKINRERVENK
jgi:hypothetical protein